MGSTGSGWAETVYGGAEGSGTRGGGRARERGDPRQTRDPPSSALHGNVQGGERRTRRAGVA